MSLSIGDGILGNPGATHSVPTALMNADGTEWVTPGLLRMRGMGMEMEKIWNITP